MSIDFSHMYGSLLLLLLLLPIVSALVLVRRVHQDTRRTTEAMIQSRQPNAETPIHRLPNELLCLVLRDSLGLMGLMHSLKPDILTLSSVCSYWYHVLRNTPTFWTTIALEHTTRIVELYAKRSQDLSLDVFLRGRVLPGHWRDKVSVLSSHAERIALLDLRLEYAITTEGSWYYTTALTQHPHAYPHISTPRRAPSHALRSLAD